MPALPQFLDQWGLTDGGLRAWAGPRLTAFPLRCLTEPVMFDPAGIDGIRKIYVSHTQPPLASLQPSLDLAVAGGWETRQLACGHDLMLAAPAETAAVLETVARPLR